MTRATTIDARMRSAKLPPIKAQASQDCARASRLRTAERCQLPPVADRTPRAFERVGDVGQARRPAFPHSLEDRKDARLQTDRRFALG